MGRNLVKLTEKKMIVSFLIQKYDVLYRHFDVATTNKVESLHCFFGFRWIKLKYALTLSYPGF